LFTLQAANRYIENLAISRAFPDDAAEAIPEEDNAEAADNNNGLLEGRSFSILQPVHNGTIQCCWNGRKKHGSSLALKAIQLAPGVLAFLTKYCVPATPDRKLTCYTSYRDPETSEVYRAHPMFMGQPSYDCAMIHWHLCPHPLPGRIRAIVDLSKLSPGGRNRVENDPECNQHNTTPGLYAIVGSFQRSDLVAGKADYSTNLIGRFRCDEARDGSG
jgi:hypothetical protein